MRKLLYFSIFIITLCLVKSEDTFKHAVLEYNFSPHDPATATDISSIKNQPSSSYNLVYINGSVPIIYENAFKVFKKLTKLSLENTYLEEIRPGAFENLPVLEEINLNNNKLHEIKSGVFTNLDVSFLFINNNTIKVLRKNAFQNSTISGIFSLEGNKIEEIGKDVFNNIFIRDIILANNSISKLEVGVFDKIFPVRGFVHRGFSVKQSFELSLKNNKLEKIDPEVFNNKKLSALVLDNNKISHIQPGDLSNMPNLISFSLSGNNLKEIPVGVFSDSHLQHITLSYNQISTIATGALDNMDSLSSFLINDNQLQVYDSNWFYNTQTIGSVSMFFNGNLIEEIPSDAFKNYPEAWHIDFSRNKIKKVASDAFNGTQKIRFMILHENLIEKWDENIFVDRDDWHINIHILDLTNNKLKCFEGDLDDIFAPVKYVRLHGNPFDANCQKKIFKYQQHNTYLYNK